jgi:hypothetical protein
MFKHKGDKFTKRKFIIDTKVLIALGKHGAYQRGNYLKQSYLNTII